MSSRRTAARESVASSRASAIEGGDRRGVRPAVCVGCTCVTVRVCVGGGSLAKLDNNVRSVGMTVEQMRRRLLELEAARRSGWSLQRVAIRCARRRPPPLRFSERSARGQGLKPRSRNPSTRVAGGCRAMCFQCEGRGKGGKGEEE